MALAAGTCILPLPDAAAPICPLVACMPLSLAYETRGQGCNEKSLLVEGNNYTVTTTQVDHVSRLVYCCLQSASPSACALSFLFSSASSASCVGNRPPLLGDHFTQSPARLAGGITAGSAYRFQDLTRLCIANNKRVIRVCKGQGSVTQGQSQEVHLWNSKAPEVLLVARAHHQLPLSMIHAHTVCLWRIGQVPNPPLEHFLRVHTHKNWILAGLLQLG